MSIINGKALVKDGKPLDRVYSNGQLVYGRNFLNGTKDFSGTWEYLSNVINDGFYNGLLIKSQSEKGTGVLKRLIATRDGDYTFSSWVSASAGQLPTFIVSKNKVQQLRIGLSNTAFDWVRVTYTLKGVKTGDVLTGRIEKYSDVAGKVSVAGHKWEFDSTATPWTLAPEDYI